MIAGPIDQVISAAASPNSFGKAATILWLIVMINSWEFVL